MGELVLQYVQRHKHKWKHYLLVVGESFFTPLDDMFIIALDVLPSSLIDSNVNLKWNQRKSKELRHVP
jgi:hypothetical protein